MVASRQGLTAKPWLEEMRSATFPPGRSPLPAAKIGLGVFLAVVGCLFTLLISAYIMRMDAGGLAPCPMPQLLWSNTGVLILSSVALQWAQVAAGAGTNGCVQARPARRGRSPRSLFLVGQLLVWRQLADEGYFVGGNPANAFFYLITGCTDCTCWAAWWRWANGREGLATAIAWSGALERRALCASTGTSCCRLAGAFRFCCRTGPGASSTFAAN